MLHRRRKMKQIVIIGIAVFSMVIAGCSSDSDKTDGGGAQSSLTAQSGPSFKVNDVSGRVRTFEEFKGTGPLVVNFWGTWCPPCRREIPDMVKIYDEYKDRGLKIVGLSVRDTPDKVKRFASEYGIEWVLLMSNYDAMKSFKTGTGIPVSIFFDRNGNEVSRFVGGRSYRDFKAEVEKII